MTITETAKILKDNLTPYRTVVMSGTRLNDHVRECWVIHHSTEIFSIDERGNVYFHHWNSRVTRKRLNKIFRLLELPFHVYQKDFIGRTLHTGFDPDVGPIPDYSITDRFGYDPGTRILFNAGNCEPDETLDRIRTGNVLNPDLSIKLHMLGFPDARNNERWMTREEMLDIMSE